MAWAKPQYSKAKVDLAGEILSGPPPSHDVVNWDTFQKYFDEVSVWDDATEVVNNWRAVHSYPLQAMKMTLKRRAKRICPAAIVAQRLKRLASIRLKLRLSKEAGQHPNLSQMQDIGGCRAVVETVEQVRSLESKFEEACRKNPHRGPQYYRTSDYIEKPKENGYRSVHLVYKFRSDSEEHSCYNGQRIEIQLRSRNQHYWATAVETYSTFSGEALKSNIGSEAWIRFFALVSSAIAILENSPTVPGTPTTMDELVPLIRQLYVELNIDNVLSGWSGATKYTQEVPDEQIQQAAMYMLVLEPENFSVTIYPYNRDQLAEANAKYAEFEKKHPELQAVLVSVDSLAALRTAYPNYFLDTNAFLFLVKNMIFPSEEGSTLSTLSA
jgi:ppGpp synthetase/RelA/SpoT-type nucleotidyltranferase